MFRIVLGQDNMQLAVLDKILKAAVENPEIVKIPNILVAGQENSLEGAVAILGASNIVKGIQSDSSVNSADEE